MKKNIVFIIMAILIISLLTACQKEKQNENETSSTDAITEVPSGDNENTQKEDTDLEQDAELGKDQDTEQDIEQNAEQDKEQTEENGTSNTEDTGEQMGLNDELSSIIDKIYESKDPGLMLATTPLDLNNMDMVNYNTGLQDVSKVKAIVVSEAMITSQAYSLVLVRTKDAADTKSVARDMLDGIDPAKWICVNADDLQIVTSNDMVMLIMMSSTFSDQVTSNQIVDAFKTISGGELDLELTK
jgi:hypothetical protein